MITRRESVGGWVKRGKGKTVNDTVIVCTTTGHY